MTDWIQRIEGATAVQIGLLAALHQEPCQRETDSVGRPGQESGRAHPTMMPPDAAAVVKKRRGQTIDFIRWRTMSPSTR